MNITGLCPLFFIFIWKMNILIHLYFHEEIYPLNNQEIKFQLGPSDVKRSKTFFDVDVNPSILPRSMNTTLHVILLVT